VGEAFDALAEMNLFELLLKNIDGTLSISEAVAILADQENSGGVSHLHMHMRDGFSVYLKPLFLINDDLSRRHYEEAHMSTAARATATGQVPVWNGVGQPPKNRFHLDERRMATSTIPSGRSKYDVRSNVPEIDEITAITDLVPSTSRYDPVQKKTVAVPVGAALPTIRVVGDVGDVPTRIKELGAPTSVPMAAALPDWKRLKDGPKDAIVSYQCAEIRQKVPKIPGSEKHTMFEDSESMAMYLCAALRSTAASHALSLIDMKAQGDVTTVALFSKTAVHQVKQHIAKINGKKKTAHAAPVVVERVTDVVPNAVRTPTTPNPVLDTFTYTDKSA
jgi:hypothetical protein